MKLKTKLLALGLTLAAALTAGILSSVNASSQPRDCDSNAIMYCGAYSYAEFDQKLNKDATRDLWDIYAHYGVTQVELSTAKDGVVMRNGNVVVDGKVVATNAHGVGRQNGAASKPVSINGKTYYERYDTSNFLSDIQAFVVFNPDGTFKYAVLKSCGNPEMATPVKIQVCDLTTWQIITIGEMAFDSNKHSKNLADCQPYAQCDGLTATVSDRTKVTLTAKGSAAHGAAMRAYEFNIRDSAGAVVWSGSVPTDQGTGSITVPMSKADTFKAQVIARTTIGDFTNANCEASFTVVPPKTPGVDVTKTVKGQDGWVKYTRVNQNVEYPYQIVVKNTGETDLKDVKVTDTPPKGVTLVSADKGEIKGNVWTYTIPELKIGASETFTINAKVPASIAGKLTNTVCVDAPEVPGNPDDCDTADVEVGCPMPGKEHLPVDSPECKDVPVTPPTPGIPELPQTGAADTLMSVLGLGSLVGAAGAYKASRKHL